MFIIKKLILLIPFVLAPVRADVVELISGDRVEGKFREANASNVQIDIAGQIVTIPIAKVRAIFLGDVPKQVREPGKLDMALEALRGLDSVTSSGISYMLYSPRVLDARVKVDQYLSEHGSNDPLRETIGGAMQYYEWAAKAWDLSRKGGELSPAVDFGKLIWNELANKSPAIREFLDANITKLKGSAGADEKSMLFMTASLIGPQPFWSCASAKSADAKGKK